MSEFKKIDSPCGIPDASWWDKNCPVRSFSCTINKGYRVVCVDDLKNVNQAGLKINPARAQGIDWKNVHALEQSYSSRGFDTTKTPPIVSPDGTVYDGNNRVEALRNLGYQFICVQVVELREGYDEDDAFDEIGLGMNNHMVAKPLSVDDAKKRLRKYFDRVGKTSQQEGIAWFSRFDHPWSDAKVKDIVNTVINSKLCKETMSPFDAKSAKKWWKEHVVSDTSNDQEIPLFLSWSAKNNDTYLARTLKEVLETYADTSVVKPVAGYLNGFNAEQADPEREAALKSVRKMNKALNLLAPKIKEAHNNGEDFDFISLIGWVPQVTGIEDTVVPPS